MIVNQTTIPRLIARDASLMASRARCLFCFGDSISYRVRSQAYLGVLAVVGSPQEILPGFPDDTNLPEIADLLEIGIGPTRPNFPARLQASRWHTWHPQRHKLFTLSPKQYRDIAPCIFEELQRLTDTATRRWRKGPYSKDPFIVPHRKHYWRRKSETNHRKELVSFPGTMIMPRGIRFSASLQDEYLIRDICWAELNLNQHIQQHLRGLAGMIGKILHDLRPRPGVRNPRPIEKKRAGQEIKRLLSRTSLNGHLAFELLDQHLPPRTTIEQVEKVARLSNISLHPTWHRRMALQVLPDPLERLQGVQLSIVRKTDHYLVFEVFPRMTQLPPSNLEEEDIPF